MQRSVEKQGRTLEEATAQALRELGANNNDVDVEILDDGKVGFLGFGSKQARVRVTLKEKHKEEQESLETPVAEPAHVESGGVKGIEEGSSEEQEGEQALDPTQARELLSGVIQRMQMDGMIETRTREGRLNLNVVGKDSNLLIGKKGQTLDSLQYLLNLMYSKSMKKKANLVVDVEEYKVRREKRLQSIAQEVRDKVKRTNKPIAIAPMNAQDRRIIHMSLQNDPYVKTVSKGEGLLRKVVVIPK
jgi:spoIIIJ-associated protein